MEEIKAKIENIELEILKSSIELKNCQLRVLPIFSGGWGEAGSYAAGEYNHSQLNIVCVDKQSERLLSTDQIHFKFYGGVQYSGKFFNSAQ